MLRNERFCNYCNKKDLEDEFYFIFICFFYIELWKKYIKSFYYKKLSVFKLVKFLSVNNIKELNNLGKYLFSVFKMRV